MNNKTSYCKQFGEPPKAAEDFVVLKQKKFRELDISKYCLELPSMFIEKWLLINDVDEFISKIYFTIRELYTLIKNQEIPNTTGNAFLTGKPAEKVPRFDKMILKAMHGDEKDRTKSSAVKSTQMQEPAGNLEEFLQQNMHLFGKPDVDYK